MSHTPTLPPALSGDRIEIDSRAGRLSYYVAGPADGAVAPTDATPLLLLHSINAAGSACEVRPLFEHYRQRRPVYALDLPGFGFSERSDRPYLPRLMTDAVHAMVDEIQRVQGAVAIDVIGVSLSSEYVARAAQEAPARFRSVALSVRRASTAEHRSTAHRAATAALPGCVGSSSTRSGATGSIAG